MNIIFDLDGTLIDSKAGIVDALRNTLAKHGATVPSDTNNLIGPPLKTVVENCLANPYPPLVDLIVTEFKAAYDTTFYKQSFLYDGVRSMLTALQDSGHKLFIATNKRTIPTLKILDHLHISKYFEKPYCIDTYQDIGHKGGLLTKILSQLNSPPRLSVYVGDRDEDAMAAGYAGIKFFHVSWGYGESFAQTDTSYTCLTLIEKLKTHSCSRE